MNLFEKIQAVSDDIKNIEKDMQVGNANYGYKAVSDNAVTQQVKLAEKKHKIVSIPVNQELVSSEMFKKIDNKGKEVQMFVDNIKMTLRIVDLEDPKSYIDIVSFGKGLDSGDKGFGKASTYARKYALLNAYKIATGEDLDAHKSEEITPITVNEKKVIVTNYMNNNVEYSNQIASHFNVDSISELKEKDIDFIYADLKKKKRL